MLYLSRKCIREKRLKKNVTFISKLIIALNIFIIYYLFNSLIYLNDNPLIIPKKELEIQESIEEMSGSNSNFLKDFIDFVKNK